jgi:hypothetical protein
VHRGGGGGVLSGPVLLPHGTGHQHSLSEAPVQQLLVLIVKMLVDCLQHGKHRRQTQQILVPKFLNLVGFGVVGVVQVHCIDVICGAFSQRRYDFLHRLDLHKKSWRFLGWILSAMYLSSVHDLCHMVGMDAVGPASGLFKVAERSHLRLGHSRHPMRHLGRIAIVLHMKNRWAR